jgi:hypothetical protein
MESMSNATRCGESKASAWPCSRQAWDVAAAFACWFRLHNALDEGVPPRIRPDKRPSHPQLCKLPRYGVRVLDGDFGGAWWWKGDFPMVMP